MNIKKSEEGSSVQQFTRTLFCIALLLLNSESVSSHTFKGARFNALDYIHNVDEEAITECLGKESIKSRSCYESFFQLLKRERIKKRVYTTREQARADIFNYIEMLYKVKRKHGSNNLLSPVNFEDQYRKQLERV